MMNPFARFKGILVRWSCPLFFKRIGPGALFYGRVRLPLPFRNVTLGRNCSIGDGTFFHTGRNSHIVIGDGTGLNTGCHVVANERITIGDNVAIAEYVSIRDQEHKFSIEKGIRDEGYNVAPVVIGSNVWIGRGVYIGPGTMIGNGSIVGANSVVRGKFPPNVLIAGAPAVVKKQLT